MYATATFFQFKFNYFQANNLLDFQKICQLPEELLHLVLSYLSAEDLWSLQSQFESESNNHENDSKLNAIFEEVWKDLCQVLKCGKIFGDVLIW